MNHSTPGLPVHHQLPEFTQTHIHRVSDALQPSHPLSSPSTPALNPSQHQVFSNESTLCMRWPKYWSLDLNQITYDYTVEMRNKFKGLDLIECLMNYGWRFMTLYRRQGSRPSPRKRKAKKQNDCLRRPCK